MGAPDGWSGQKTLSGQEQLRLYNTTTYTLTATGPGGSVTQSVTVTVTNPAPTDFSVSASPSVVAPGDTITVTWGAPPAQLAYNDWIGMYAQGAPNNQYLGYRYTSGQMTGSVTFTAPSTPGDYEFRYLLKGQYQSVATSNVVTVQ